MLTKQNKMRHMSKRPASKYSSPARRNHFRKRNVVTYTGSPDSVDVAKLLEQFHYHPAQQKAVLDKYARLVNDSAQ